MELDEIERMVRVALEQARDALGRIEIEVREHGETRPLVEASRLYARFCMHARDYLSGIHTGRPRPRRLAAHVAELREGLAALAEVLAAHGLHPDVADLDDLVEAVNAVPGAM